MKKYFCALLVMTSFILAGNNGQTPGKDYFPTSSSDWAYMAKYHETFNAQQRIRAALQSIAIKLDEKCDCGVVYKVNLVSNNEGRFWEGAWGAWDNNITENRKVLDVILESIDSLELNKSITPKINLEKPFKLKSW